MSTPTTSSGAITPNQANVAIDVQINKGSLNGRDIFHLYELNDDHIFQIMSQLTFKFTFTLVSVCKRFHTLFHTKTPELMTAKVKQIFAAVWASFLDPLSLSRAVQDLKQLDFRKSWFSPKAGPDKTSELRFVDQYKATKDFIIIYLSGLGSHHHLVGKNFNFKDLEFEDFPKLMLISKIMCDFEIFIVTFKKTNLNAIFNSMNGIANPQRQDLNRLFIEFFCSAFIGQEHDLKSKSEMQNAIWNPFSLSIARLQHLNSPNAQKAVILLLENFIRYNLDKKNYDLIIDLIKTLGDHMLSNRLRLSFDKNKSFFEAFCSCSDPDLSVAIKEHIKNHENELQTNIIHLLRSIVIGNGLNITNNIPIVVDLDLTPDDTDPHFLEKIELHNKKILSRISDCNSFYNSCERVLSKEAKLKVLNCIFYLINTLLIRESELELKEENMLHFIRLFLSYSQRSSSLEESIDSFLQSYTIFYGEKNIKCFAQALCKNIVETCMQDKVDDILIIISKLSKYIMTLDLDENCIISLAYNENVVQALKKQLEDQDVNLDVYARTIANMIIHFEEFQSKLYQLEDNYRELISEKLLDSFFIGIVEKLTDQNASDAFIYYWLICSWFFDILNREDWDEDPSRGFASFIDMTILISVINDDDLRAFLMRDFVSNFIRILSGDEIKLLTERLGDHARNCLQDALNEYNEE